MALFAGLIGRQTLVLNLARILAAALTWAFKFVTMQHWVFPPRQHPDRQQAHEATPTETSNLAD